MENAFSPFVRILGKGKTGSRALTQSEAHDAMRLILAGEVEDVQLGAFLMLLRVKEESAEELAGFASACRDYIFKPKRDLSVDLDWSSYAGKRKQPHWFILAALLLAHAGHRVIMHGTRGHTENRVYTQEVLSELDIEPAANIDDAIEKIAQTNFAYLPLENFCQPMQRIIDLRPLFGLRSPVHTLCRLINPLAANATVQSVFHPSYMQSHNAAAGLLGEERAIVLKGDAGEVEYRPHASVKIMRLVAGRLQETVLPRHDKAPAERVPTTDALRELWQSPIASELNSYAYHAVMGTAAIGLLAMQQVESFEQGFERAIQYWKDRDPEYI